MTKITKEHEDFISDKINRTLEEVVAKIKKPYLKFISGLGVVILLETGALIWSLAIGTSEDKHQNKAVKELSETVNLSIKSNNDLIKELSIIAIQNAEKTEANKNRLDRSPY